MKIGRGVSELWRVENRHLPLTWPMAYTTACTTEQAVINPDPTTKQHTVKQVSWKIDYSVWKDESYKLLFWGKRWVFKRFLKTYIDDADVTFSGRVFHNRAAATGKVRSPMGERRVRGTTSDDVDAERRRWRASTSDAWW